MEAPARGPEHTSPVPTVEIDRQRSLHHPQTGTKPKPRLECLFAYELLDEEHDHGRFEDRPYAVRIRSVARHFDPETPLGILTVAAPGVPQIVHYARHLDRPEGLGRLCPRVRLAVHCFLLARRPDTRLGVEHQTETAGLSRIQAKIGNSDQVGGVVFPTKLNIDVQLDLANESFHSRIPARAVAPGGPGRPRQGRLGMHGASRKA